MKKNSLEAFQLDKVNLESVHGGRKVIETTMTNGNCDEVTMTGLFNNRVDEIYEGPYEPEL